MRQLAIIMFTDIEGFTAILQKDEHQGKELHDGHRSAVSQLVPKNEGRLIQFYGDGSLSIFSSSLKAIECAIEMQDRFRGGDLSIPVRVGLHLGEVVLSEKNVFGDPVNIAARIESLAASGSILISEKVFLEVANRPEVKTAFFGIYHFKNVRRPMKIYAIDDPRLVVPRQAHDGAKLIPDYQKSNLPRYNDEFIGRSKLMQRLNQTIIANPNAIISLVGAGGLGKTRLAVEVANKIQDQFRQGVCFVAFDTLQDSKAVPTVIGSALGLQEHAELDWTERIRDYLMDREVLLVLDNIEHVLDCAPLLDNLIDGCPLLTILCTSRRSLELNREIEFPLEVMQVPSSRYQVGNLDNECIMLFERRAQRAKPNFTVDADNYPDVAEICRSLDGVPLAIELAAARTKMLSARDIRAQLSHVFRILKSSKLPNPRHRAIYETIKWSYDLLSKQEREVLVTLSIVPGNISINLVEAFQPDVDAFEMIERLFNHSLIYRATDTHSLHYRMLSLVRKFGQIILEEKQILKSKKRTFAKLFGDHLNRSLKNPDLTKKERIQLLDDSFDNLRFVINFWTEENLKTGTDLLLKTWRYYLSRGLIREAQEKVQFFMENGDPTAGEMADLQIAYGTLSQNLGHFIQSRNAYSSALKHYVEVQSLEPMTIALNHLSWAEFRLGNYEKSNSYAEHALEQAEEIGNQRHVCRSLNNLAWVHHFQGNAIKASKIYTQILDKYTSLADDHGIAFSRTNKGWTLVDMGQIDQALTHLERAIETFHNLKNRQLYAFAHLVLAMASQESGSLHKAIETVDQICLPIFTHIGDTWGLGLAIQKLAEMSLARGDTLDANEQLAKSLEIRTRIHDRWGVTYCHALKAEYHLALDDPFEARRHVEIAVGKAEEMNCQGLLIRLHGAKARIYWQNNRPYEAASEIDLALNKLDNAYQRQKFEANLHDIYAGLKELKIPFQYQ